MSSNIGPPQNTTRWPDLGLALQIVYDSKTGVAEKKKSIEGHFRIVERFKECLDTLEACFETEKFPEGYVLESSYSITGSYGISYVSVQCKIAEFSDRIKRDYKELFNNLRVTANQVLRGINPPPESGKIFEDFARYIEGCRD